MAYLSNKEIAYLEAHIADDRRGDILATAIVTAFLATAVVTARLACRRQMKAAIFFDDYWIVVTLVSRIQVLSHVSKGSY